MSIAPILTGGCLCGGVRYEIAQPLEFAGWCHCTRCQRRSGCPASAGARVVPGSLRIVQGEELVGSFRPPDGWVKEFCTVCGSQLFSRHPSEPQRASVRLGTVDGDPGVRLSYRQYVAYAAEWDEIPDDGLPRFLEARP